MLNFKKSTLFVLFLLLSSCSNLPNKTNSVNRGIAGDTVELESAYDAYNLLRRAPFIDSDTQLRVLNSDETVNNGVISFGGEKEGSTSRIAKVFSPLGTYFEERVLLLEDDNRKVFLINFLKEIQSKPNQSIETLEGEKLTLDKSFLNGIDIQRQSLEELDRLLSDWVRQTHDRPFCFLSYKIRKQIFDSKFPGLSPPLGLNIKDFQKWVPQFGLPEKFLDKVISQSVVKGWEILTKPQYSYGEHEQMIRWFRTTMGESTKEFESPGHQRIMWPKPKTGALGGLFDSTKFNSKLASLYRLSQAYIVLRGIAGKTGINFGHWKFLMADSELKSLDLRRNDVFRLERDKFGVEGSMGLEMRAGTKDQEIQRFIQQIISSRVATQDFSDISGIDDWELIPKSMVAGGFPSDSYSFERFIPSVEPFAKKFELSEEVVQNAFSKIQSIKRSSPLGFRGDQVIPIRYEFWVPFWNWDQAPFLSKEKKDLINELTKNFIVTLDKLEEPTVDQIQKLFQDWVKISNLTQDIEEVMKPNKQGIIDAEPHRFHVAEDARVNVNEIDQGIEYSARLPLKNKLVFTEELDDGKKHWIGTTFDLTREEREETIHKFMMNLANELGADPNKIEKVEGLDDHGHGLDLAFKLTDKDGRTWRAEWDGIGRSYNSETRGVIMGSERGGHIEVVTPKFEPGMKEIDAVYNAFEKTNLVPQFASGGSHINIDLEAFKGKPRELARFMAAFHEHRSIISLMYQHPGRRSAAEALDLDPEFAKKLANFDGTEKDLKKLLYNSRYFNTRIGRKTRYVHLDMSAYFQEFIPDEFISKDFDIGNPWVNWRRQFRVNPKILKAEFRLFGAPEDSLEAALQIKLVRGLLDKALNGEDVLSGKVQNLTHEDYIKNPEKAFEDLKKLAMDLNLDPTEYEMSLSRGLEATQKFVKSPSYKSVAEKLKFHKKIGGWKKAKILARSAEKTKNIMDVDKPPRRLEGDVKEYMERRQVAATKADRLRAEFENSKLFTLGKIIRKKKPVNLPKNLKCRDLLVILTN